MIERKIDKKMEIEIKEEIDKALRTLKFGHNYRDYSEKTIDKLYNHIANIIEDDLVGRDVKKNEDDRLVVNEDMVITAMMMELAEVELNRTNVLLSNALSYIMDIDMPGEDRDTWYENLKNELGMSDEEMINAGVDIEAFKDMNEPEL